MSQFFPTVLKCQLYFLIYFLSFYCIYFWNLQSSLLTFLLIWHCIRLFYLLLLEINNIFKWVVRAIHSFKSFCFELSSVFFTSDWIESHWRRNNIFIFLRILNTVCVCVCVCVHEHSYVCFLTIILNPLVLGHIHIVSSGTSVVGRSDRLALLTYKTFFPPCCGHWEILSWLLQGLESDQGDG